MRLALDSCRGLFAGWVIAATVPLLVSSVAIAEWSAIGFGDRYRIALAAVEILGALLFAFRRLASLGAGLLLLSFLVAGALHFEHGYWPWWLGLYAVVVVVLERGTRRQIRAG